MKKDSSSKLCEFELLAKEHSLEDLNSMLSKVKTDYETIEHPNTLDASCFQHDECMLKKAIHFKTTGCNK